MSYDPMTYVWVAFALIIAIVVMILVLVGNGP